MQVQGWPFGKTPPAPLRTLGFARPRSAGTRSSKELIRRRLLPLIRRRTRTLRGGTHTIAMCLGVKPSWGDSFLRGGTRFLTIASVSFTLLFPSYLLFLQFIQFLFLFIFMIFNNFFNLPFLII